MYDSFENEVRQKMEELNMVPSMPVWEKVALQIKPDKGRRRFFIWMLFYGLLLAGGGIILFTDTNTIPRNVAAVNPVKTIGDTPPDTTKKTSATTDHRRINNSSKLVVDTTQQNTALLTNSRHYNSSQQQTADKESYITPAPGNTYHYTEKPISQKSSNEIKEQPELNEVVTQKATMKNTEGEPLKRKPLDTDNNVITTKPVPSVDSAATSKKSSDTTKQILKDSPFKKQVAGNTRKWKKQIIFAVGASSFLNDQVNLRSRANNPVASYSSLSSGNSNPLSSIISNYPNHSFFQSAGSGLGFSFGFALSKQLSKKWEISGGLQYAHHSTYTTVGEKELNAPILTYDIVRDSLVSNQSNSYGSRTIYTNRLDVIEVPVAVFYRPFDKLPAYFSVGIAYGRLLSTNALTFSSSTYRYYVDSSKYVRNMLPVSVAILAKISIKKMAEIRLGPTFEYNLIKLRKENNESTPHLVFAGIKSIVSF